MSEPASFTSSIAARYALAVFEIAQEADQVADLEKNIDVLSEVLDTSEDFNAMLKSPLLSRGAQGQAIAAVAAKLGLSEDLSNTLALMASKRRLFVVPALIGQLRALIAEQKGEETADVISAKALTKTQTDKLTAAIKAQIGKDVKINAAVDKDLIGGLIVKVGSKMIDTSIRSKLNALQNVMKEVGSKSRLKTLVKRLKWQKWGACSPLEMGSRGFMVLIMCKRAKWSNFPAAFKAWH